MAPDTVYQARLTPLLLSTDFSEDSSFWKQVPESQRWDSDQYEDLEGTGARLWGPNRVMIAEIPERDQYNIQQRILVLEQDRARSSRRYRILDYDLSSRSLALDGQPDLAGESSAWRVLAHSSVSRASGQTEELIFEGGEPWTQLPTAEWTDYRVSAVVQLPDFLHGNFGLLFRVQGDAHYCFRIHCSENQEAGAVYLEKCTSTPETLHSRPFVCETNTVYRIAVEAIGTSLRAYVNDALVLEEEDAAFPSGSVGLYSSQGRRNSFFYSLQVEDFSGGLSSVYDFSFVTSQYVNFFHHLHSFQDELWPVTIPADQSLPRPNPRGVETSRLPLAVSPREATAYERLAFAVFGADAYTLPEQVEIAVIVSENGIPLLHLHSPEPIDWERTSLCLSFASGQLPQSQRPTHFKLTDVSFADPPSETESVTLLLREAANLNGYRIEYRLVLAESEQQEGEPAPPFQAGQLVLEEDFSQPDLQQWHIVDEPPYSSRSSEWAVVNQELHQSSNIYGFVGGTYNDPGTYIVTGDRGWTDYRFEVRLRSDDNDAIGVLFRYQDENNFYRFSMDRERRYRRLIKKVNGVVTLLWSDQERYRRFFWHTLRIDCLGSQLIATLDGEPLLAVIDSDIDFGRIGLYCRANRAARFDSVRVTADARAWNVYYQFEQEKDFATGSRVEVHARPFAEETQPAFEPRPLEFRLRTPDAVTVHQRAFSPHQSYREIEARPLRKADGTAFFLMPPSDGDRFESGQYSLEMTYLRTLENRPPEQQLSQLGHTEPEMLRLDFSLPE